MSKLPEDPSIAPDPHDKTTWGEGTWQTEADDFTWTHPATGYVCEISRSPIGSPCGYVTVPPGHPYHGNDMWGANADVHGGITLCVAQPDGDGWVIGFDCAHLGDWVPYSNALLAHVAHDLGKPRLGVHPLFGGAYRHWNYVAKEVTSLAEQLGAMT